jgi:hypothetical protein
MRDLTLFILIVRYFSYKLIIKVTGQLICLWLFYFTKGGNFMLMIMAVAVEFGGGDVIL